MGLLEFWGDFFERYNNLKKDEKIIIKNEIDKIILKK